MAKPLSHAINTVADALVGQSHNRYTLSINQLAASLSVVSIQGSELLNQPWRYDVTFTCRDKQIRVGSVLSQSASLTFLAPGIVEQVAQISSLEQPASARTLYGVVTEFSLLSVNKDEARYRVVLQPRLALFANDHYSAIYQNQSVVSVVEEVLRRHGFTGVDYRLELKDSYPAREFITQWQETDLAFIQRLMADVGIWFRFESHADHSCDVLVISDYEQGLQNAGSIVFKAPSGMVDSQRHSVWNIQFSSKTMPRQVMVDDYNYRAAESDMYSLVNSQAKDTTTRGTDYRYGEHYQNKGNDSKIESGNWYAKIRHEHYISNRIIISGQCNDYQLTPGQRIIIDGSPINGINEGVIIISTQSYGDRTESYQTSFTAIPYDVLKPYRPAALPWPQVSGTLPARITSPDNDTYGYIDTLGRYRVKFKFDLKTWRSGEESLWVRLAKPYAGDTYGFHFPLIDGTEVAIAFTDGNPDRPYIAHAMHDSTHPDHVATANKHRNVIRTPANNKLRMDDKRSQEHIKLATEYGKTQLNLGHLVSSEKEKRGEGFELRTDEWGAIRAGKGLYVTTEEQAKAGDLQLQMDSAVKELEQAANMVKQLNELAQAAKAELADLQSQKQLLQQSLKDLQQPAILNYAPSGIADVTPSSIQQTAGENIIQTAQSTVDISAFKRFMVTAGNMISLFANKMGIKIFASKGNVDIQAQNDQMLLTAKQEMKITSTDSEVIISASKKLTLACDGVAIILEGGSIKLMAPGDVEALAASFGVVGPASYRAPMPALPAGATCAEEA
ncbi:type VI secretion system secreted protein VgrG [Orbus hercynius]|uniref:Type VI secretion system secreted protein VgrG n=1 Tax=Orbus hercynius TaxID=593135 RepID=A0A495RFC2_9GAMM|nr:type VI secretion system Vgr family protein [Orbus hercynius]RKS86099.1 type VI secretion system secreted protein VgrG [Orbus hercynius]